MSEDEFDHLYLTGGSYAPDAEGNSLDNNIDMKSDRGGNLDNTEQRKDNFVNLLNDDYENQWDRQKNLATDLDNCIVRSTQYEKDSIQYRLINATSFQQYDDALSEYKASLNFYSAVRLAKILEIILGEKRNVNNYGMQFSCNCIFLRYLCRLFKQTEDIQSFQEAIAVILDPSKQFYRFQIGEQGMQIMNIYLEQQNPDLNSVHSLVSEFDTVQIKMAVQRQENELYSFYFNIFLESCLRKSKIRFNIFLISRALPARQQFYMQQFGKDIEISQGCVIDKKQLEDYLTLLIQICKNSQFLTQQHIFKVMQWLILDNEQIQRKLLGFKIIKDLIVEFRSKDKFKYILVNWLVQNKIIDNFLRDSTHSRILQQIQPIIHFLYEQGVLGDFEIIELMKYSLHSQQIFKVVQAMLGWLKIQHLFLVFQIIPFHNDRESTLFINFISTVLSNPLISDENSRKRRNVIVQDNHRQEGETEIEIDENSELMQQFVKKLLHFLIEFVVQHQNNYMPILLKLISSHSKMFKDDLFNQIIKLLKNNSVCSLWIIQHWLKIETARDRGQGKYQLIITLASQGVFQLMLALLARHRFSRLVVEKALSVIIFFCRFNKPLERNIVEFLWKVLGTTGRDERERQQFFVFLKELVRYEGSITEESVNFIFFDILLSLVAYWFTLRVYDCLQMLFLRLNEDCKLISFEKDHYKIQKLPLIGTDKFLYIYFNCLDLKVVKKCKDFIWRLLSNAQETREGMNLYIIACLRKYMTYALQMVKQQQLNKRQVIVLRVFDIAEKISLQKQKQQEGKQTILNLNIQVANLHTLGSKNLMLEFNEKIILSDLRCYIGDNLNPPAKNIELWTKGKLLKGENLTLKQLKLQSGQTISVSKSTEIDIEEDKASIKQNQLQTLTSIIGSEHDQQFLKFVIDKFEGENIETIANNMFDPQRLQAIQQEFKQKKTEKDEMVIEIMDTKSKIKSFGSLLVHQKDVFMLILECLKISQNKLSGWNFIKRLPLNEDCVEQVKQYMSSGLWAQLFRNKTTEQSMYLIHILTNYIRLNYANLSEIFHSKKLGLFLKSWLSEIVNSRPEQLNNYYDMLKLMLLQIECPILTCFDDFLHKKSANDTEQQLVSQLQAAMKKQRKGQFWIDSQVIYKLLESLIKYNPCEKVVEQISKIYMLQLIYSSNQNCFSILEHPSLSFLLLKYGKPIQFVTIVTAVQRVQNFDDSYLSKLVFKLLSALKYQKRVKEQKLSFASYFSCINQLLKISAIVDSRTELQVLTGILSQLKTEFTKLQEQQIVGYFKISTTLIDRHFKSERGGERKNEDIYHFAEWLFNEYLFDKKNISPIVAAKNIRKGAYQLLVKMCGYHDILNLTSRSVKSIMSNFKDTNEVEGQIRTGQFLGIKNLGATCYINSLLQQLYHTTFPAQLLEEDNKDNQQPIKLFHLKKLFVNLYSSIRSPVFPNDFVQTVKINGQIVRPMVQQDVNEFFISLMHDIQQAVGNKAINQTICGSLCHEIRGLEEGSEVKNVDQTFLTFMIDIKYRKNIHQAISSFSKPHFLEGENMYYSQVLHKKIRASSKTYLGKLPNLLVITLKRFYWNFQQMNRIKINDYFDFPLQLQLSRYAMPGRKQSDPHYFQYKLSGIIIHSGSAESGHYYSLIKVGEQWFQFNDKKVTPWDIQNNLKGQCFGGNDQKSRNAYMLFYERVGAKVYGESLNTLPQKNKMLKLVQQQNQKFMLNRRIYDSNFIDFIKELSRFPNQSLLLKLLQKIKYYRQTESCPIIPEIVQESINGFEMTKVIKETDILTQDHKPRGVTKDEMELFAKTYYPNSSVRNTTMQQGTGNAVTQQLYYDVEL